MSLIQSCRLVTLGVSVEGEAALEWASNIFSVWRILNVTEPHPSTPEESVSRIKASYAVPRQQQGYRQ